MKNNSYLVIVLAAGILSASSSCRKDNPGCDTRVSTNKDSTSIEGTWELHHSYDGRSGDTETLPDCNGNRLVFTGNVYKRYTLWKLTREGAFRIVKDTMRVKGKGIGDRIIMDADTISRHFLHNSGTALSIKFDAFDGPESVYTRRND